MRTLSNLWTTLLRTALGVLCLAALACGSRDASSAGDKTAAHADHEPAGASHDKENEEGHDDAAESRVTLTAAAERTAEIAVEPVVAMTASTASASDAELVVPGTVEADPRRVAAISPRVAGRLERVVVVEGDRVKAGTSVAYVWSPAYTTAQTDYLQALRRAALLRGTSDAAGAEALVVAARRRLTVMGVSNAAIEKLGSGGEPESLLALTAPFDASILHADAMPGAALEAGAPVFTIADLSTADVVASVPERAIASLRVGQPATVTIAAYPTVRLSGYVERVREALDPATRTVGAVVHVLNASRTLRPGMYATVALHVPGTTTANASRRVGDGTAVLTVSESAVVTDGTQGYVFVRVADRTYERRAVSVTPLAPGDAGRSRVAVSGALRAGDSVVIRGAFILKSELGKAELSGHGH